MSPNSCKVVQGAGMPIIKKSVQDETITKGCLYILFDVEFPKHLTKAQKEQIGRILA